MVWDRHDGEVIDPHRDHATEGGQPMGTLIVNGLE
jgi:hypothetical protein